MLKRICSSIVGILIVLAIYGFAEETWEVSMESPFEEVSEFIAVSSETIEEAVEDFEAIEFVLDENWDTDTFVNTNVDDEIFGLVTCNDKLLKAKDLVDSGMCGTAVRWALDTEGVLTISGSGATDNWPKNTMPWYEVKEKIKSVVIGDGITEIGSYAFRGCDALISVSMPEEMRSIGRNAFSGCTKLESIVIPMGVKSVEEYVFSGCSGLTSVFIPEGVDRIGNWAFQNCIGLTAVTIPKSVTDIGAGAFNNCYALESIVIQEGVRSIGASAFALCSRLKDLILPEGIIELGDYVFNGCIGLETINLPKSIEKIGDQVFYGCSGLKNVTIPSELNFVCQHPAERVEQEGIKATCTSTGYTDVTVCVVCGVTMSEREEIPAGHSYEEIPGKPATTTSTGLTDGLKCNVCGKMFVEQTEIPILEDHEHITIVIPDIAANCTRTGSTGGMMCSICGKIITEPKETGKTDHVVKMIPEAYSTSVSEGKSAYSVCENCGMHLSEPTVVPAMGVYSVTKLTIGVGEKYTPIVVGSEVKKFKTSNKKIVTVSENGVIKGKKKGTAKITVIADNGYTQVITVNVKKAATRVTLKKTAKMRVGETMALKAKVSGTSYKRTWDSSKKNVAIVDENGIVIAIGKGTSTISVKTFNGKKARCKITVK